MIKKGIPEDTAKTISESLQKSNVYEDFLNDKNIFFGESRMLFHHIDPSKKRDGLFTSQKDHHFAPSNKHIFYSDPRKNEIRGVYNVSFNDKKSTSLQATDVSLFSGNRKWGANHTIKKHLGEGKEGEITLPEFLTMGDVIRNGLEKNIGTRKTYTSLAKDGATLKVIVDTKGKDIVEISMFSNRKKENQGGLNNEPHYGNLDSLLGTYIVKDFDGDVKKLFAEQPAKRADIENNILTLADEKITQVNSSSFDKNNISKKQ